MDQPTRPLSSADFLAQLRSRRVGRGETPTVSQPVAPTTPDEYDHSYNEPLPETPVRPTVTIPTFTAPAVSIPPQPVTQPYPVDSEPYIPFDRPQPEEVIYEWEAASRPFKKRNRQYYTTIAAIVVLISLILFFAGQFLPIAVVVSVGFLAYVLSSIPPETVTHRFSTYGVYMGESFFQWEELGRFWFGEKFTHPMLYIEVGRFPGRLMLLVPPEKKEEVIELLSQVLLQEKPADGFVDRAANWLQKKIPLDPES
jgi:hypothetical protein